jgi:hypothetical protein
MAALGRLSYRIALWWNINVYRDFLSAYHDQYLVIDLRHYLTPGGTLAELPGRARRLAEYWTEIVAQGSNFDQPAALRCRRRPKHRTCSGMLDIGLTPDFSGIMWCCPVRGDNGVIRGWHGRFWDNGDTPEFSR